MKRTRKHRKQRGGILKPSSFKQPSSFKHNPSSLKPTKPRSLKPTKPRSLKQNTTSNPSYNKPPSLRLTSRSLPNLRTSIQIHVVNPIFKIKRVPGLKDMTKDTNGNMVWFFNIPQPTDKTQKYVTNSLQNGGAIGEIKPMPVDEIEERLINPSGMSCSLTENTDNCRLNINGTDILSFGRGTFNAVFDEIIFKDCDPTKHILRISIKSLDIRTHNPPYNNDQITEAVNEIYYSLVAANWKIGPKIYKFGSMVDSENPSNVYIYIVMERVDGCDIHKLLNKIEYPPLTNTTNYCDSVDYPVDFVTKFESIIIESIKQLTIAGTTCGLLMMDSKPQNMLTTKDGGTVYVIDYDEKFMFYEEKSQETKIMYGKINVILFLCNLYYYFVLSDIKNTKKEQFKTIIGKRILEKIKKEYYESPDFEQIRDYIQELYFSEEEFTNICHHYKYVQSEMLKIRFLIPYHLTFYQIYQMQELNKAITSTFFIEHPTVSIIKKKYPIRVEKRTLGSKKFLYKIEIEPAKPAKPGKPGVKAKIQVQVKEPYDSIVVYSINRLCINTSGVPFDFKIQDIRGNLTAYAQNNPITQYNKKIINEHAKLLWDIEYELVNNFITVCNMKREYEYRKNNSELETKTAELDQNTTILESASDEPTNKKRKLVHNADSSKDPNTDKIDQEIEYLKTETEEADNTFKERFLYLNNSIYNDEYDEYSSYDNVISIDKLKNNTTLQLRIDLKLQQIRGIYESNYKKNFEYFFDSKNYTFGFIRKYSIYYNIITETPEPSLKNPPFVVDYDNLLTKQSSILKILNMYE